MKSRSPVARDLVLIGGGHSHTILLRRLAMKPLAGLQVTLVSPEVSTTYSGMLPGVVAGHYDSEDIHIDLVRLCRFAGARFFKTNAFSIDPVAKTVACDGRPPVSYDVLSIDTGITPSLDGTPGARENVIAVKPIGLFLQKWERFHQRALAGDVRDVAFVGAGAGGVELCMAAMHRMQRDLPDNEIRFHLISDQEVILPEFDDGTRRRFERHCGRRGVELHLDFPVTRVARGTLISAHGDSLDMDEIFWVTSAAAPAWLADTGISVSDDGFITVRNTLQTHSHDEIFATGDIAVLTDHPRPRAGVFAVRQGPVLARNSRRYLLGKSLRSWRPQKEFLRLITTGDRYAVACRNGRSIEGRWVWHWKNWIDKRFIRRFSKLPPVKVEKYSGLLKEFETVHCGGCGVKVGADILYD
ncbi:MAG: FAD-dependent oxidoreductase, partial [Pseudomonadales bacterium]|nr:FAD-dependent oxidoreductase [Pseudomonadales bacterium]